MEKKEKIRLLIGVILNTVVLIAGIYCISTYFKCLILNDPEIRFRYFTNLSVITVTILSIPNIIFLLMSLIKGKMIYPKWFSITKFVGLSMTTLTFFTVVLILAPLTSYKEMFENVRFFTHLIIPVLVVVSFLFFEEKTLFEWQYTFLSFVPTFLYSITYTVNVIILGNWPDIYQINRQGIWYVYEIAIDLFGFILAVGLYFLKKAILKNNKA